MKKLAWPLAVAAIITAAAGHCACGGVERDNDETGDECVQITGKVEILSGGEYECGTTIPLRYGETLELCVSCGDVFSLVFNGPGKIIFKQKLSNVPFNLRFRLPDGTINTASEVSLAAAGTATATVP